MVETKEEIKKVTNNQNFIKKEVLNFNDRLYKIEQGMCELRGIKISRPDENFSNARRTVHRIDLKIT